MKAFRIGFITTLSFLLVLSIVTGVLGFYPAPQGEKAPEYPTNTYSSGFDFNSAEYQTQQAENAKKQAEYQENLKKYQESQKTFLQDKIIPYAQTVFVIWIAAIIVFEIIGLVLVTMSSNLVGSGFAFSGFWAVIFWPIGGIMWFASSLVSSFGGRANQQFTTDPLLQAVCIISVCGIVILSVVGYILELKNKPLLM